MSEISEFTKGVGDGLDPQPEIGEQAGDGTAVTNGWSWWSGIRCARCGHTYRRGDRVRLVPGLPTPLHLDPILRCAVDDGQTARSGGLPEDWTPIEFAAALMEVWPPLNNVPVTLLAPDDWRVASPRRGARRSTCLYCAHTFRPGEHVVICPCRHSASWPAGVGACGEAVHRDPAVGLPCWETWCPTGKVSVCPVRLNRLEDSSR
jgi:hypothetical protein